MKWKNCFAMISMLLINNALFAAPTQTISIKQPSFSRINWHATMQNGGFVIVNQTEKKQYIEVVIKTGEISVLTLHNGSFGSCKQNLNASMGPYSVICELAPNDAMEADIDFEKMAEATGTYQIKM